MTLGVTSTPALIWVYGLDKVQVGVFHDVKDLEIEDRLQGLETLKFSLRANDPKVVWAVVDAELRYGVRLYRIQELNKRRESNGQIFIDVVAYASWVFLKDILKSGIFTISAKTITQGLNLILAHTDWTVGAVPSDSTQYSMEDTDTSVLEFIRTWAKITENEVIFNYPTKEVTFTAQQGSTTGTSFRYRRNLREIKRKEIPPTTTRLFAYGANDISISASNPTGFDYVEDYTYYTSQGVTLADARTYYTKDAVWIDDSYVSTITLLDAATARIALLSQATVSYQCKVIDLSNLTGLDEDSFGIGDLVTVQDDGLDIDIVTRIVRIKRFPLDHVNNEIELSSLIPSLDNITSGGRTNSPKEIKLLVDENADVAAISTVAYQDLAFALSFSGAGNLVIGLSVTGTATGTGNFQADWWWRGTRFDAPLISIPFVAGPVSFNVPIALNGLEESGDFFVRLYTSAGSISCPVGHARMYILGFGLLGGGLGSGNPNVFVSDAVEYADVTYADSILVEFQTPLAPSATDTVTTADGIPAIADSASTLLV